MITRARISLGRGLFPASAADDCNVAVLNVCGSATPVRSMSGFKSDVSNSSLCKSLLKMMAGEMYVDPFRHMTTCEIAR